MTPAMGPVARDKWVCVLWLVAICDARGGACGSSNQHVSAHRHPQLWRLGDMYLDIVHWAGIS